MKIATLTYPGSTFVCIETESTTMQVKTDTGAAGELIEAAAQMRGRANDLLRRADIIEQAAEQMKGETK